MKLLLLLLLTSLTLSEDCPNPKETWCIAVGRYDRSGDPAMCKGYGCPPCWKKYLGEWKCYDRKDIDCESHDIIDLVIYDKTCDRYKRAFDFGSDGVLNLAALDSDKPKPQSQGGVLNLSGLK